jgi:phenylpyruvate tautomerase PptA (4-oxalocrotonate tautomerase family)
LSGPGGWATLVAPPTEGDTMPLVRIDLHEGRSDEELAAIGDGVHQAMIETIGVPADDRFQVITEHPGGDSSTTRTTSASTATAGSC